MKYQLNEDISQPVDGNRRTIQAVQPQGSTNTQVLVSDGVSTEYTSTIDQGNNQYSLILVRIVFREGDGAYSVGDSAVTASIDTDVFLPQNVVEYVAVRNGQYIAVNGDFDKAYLSLCQ